MSGSVSQKTPWRGEMYLPKPGIRYNQHAYLGKKNILSFENKKKKAKNIHFFFS
jgi:hypothetical protein